MSGPEQVSTPPKIVFFTDFDGTITTIDSNDYLVAKLGYGEKLLDQSNLDVLEGRVSLREALVDQMHSINYSLEDCIEFQCKFIELDHGFVTFYRWARAFNIPVIILSGGLQPLIRALLAKLLDPEEASAIELHSNDVEPEVIDPEAIDADVHRRRNWKVKLHDESDFGFDKAARIRKSTEKLLQGVPESSRPALLFAGDGVLTSAPLAHLVKYCEGENIGFTPFDNWEEILRITQAIS
ncbi:HAD-like domain-containing protein [Leptodontidium sp. 2 PMI_412]|nr:HAD-like domain-containing protein [Leptodontidium sp. 2 PMI_412]